MLSKKYRETKICKRQSCRWLLVNSLLGTVMLYSFGDVANAIPPETETNSLNQINEQLTEQKNIASSDSDANNSGTPLSPLTDKQPPKETKISDKDSADLTAKDSISAAPVTPLKPAGVPPTLEEWKANVPTTAARELVSPATVQLEDKNAVSESQNSPDLQAQATPEVPAAQPTNAPVSSELKDLRQKFLLEEPMQAKKFAVAPPSSIVTPIPFGAAFGQVFGGFGFQERARYTEKSDGAIAVGAGLGDAVNVVGLDVTVAVLSLFGNDSFERGGIGFKLHRWLPEDFAIAAGVENAIIWGNSDAGTSAYGVVGKFFRFRRVEEPFSQMTVSVGVGGGRFRSEDDIINGVDSVGVFGSIGLQVLEPMTLITEWSGQDLNIGASFLPFRNIPLTITLGGADITNNAGDGARFIMSIGYNYLFPR